MKAIAIAFGVGAVVGAGVATALQYVGVIRDWLKRGGNIDVGH